MDNNFTHLHFHTSYSFLDGYNPIDRAVARVKELGMTACAITDHNHLAGIPQFVDECKAQGIKPIIGYEGYFTPDITIASKSAEERRDYAIEGAIEAGAVTQEQVDQAFSKKNRKGWMTMSELKEAIAPYTYDMHQFHILYLAKNQTGWNNLIKLQSESARLCTYNGRFLADFELIKKYSEGIICTTACIGSYPSRMIEEGDFESAELYITEMKNIFGDDFYLEIQPLNIEKQWHTNYFYIQMSQKHEIKLVAANDVHYTLKEDYDDHDTMLCIGLNQYKTEEAARKIYEKKNGSDKNFVYNRMRYDEEFWIKSRDEMDLCFRRQTESSPQLTSVPEWNAIWQAALDETNRVADKVTDDILIGSKTPLFPKVKVPNGLSAEDYLTMISFNGLYQYLASHPECNKSEYEQRLTEELNIINPKGFAPYMLTVREYANWADTHGCPVGPGRGSAAGSLVLFCTGITKNIDPIKNQLWFSRFLTADRKEVPDIDLDFSWEQRDSVIEHLEDYYGKDHVAHIGTYTTMGVKNGLSDVGRVMGEDFGKMKRISKILDEINDAPGASFKDYDKMKDGNTSEQDAWRRFRDLEEENPELFRLARAFEGTPRNTGVHASGILVTPEPITNYFPVHYVDGVAVTYYDGPTCEHYDTVKLDILGLKNLSIIKKCLNNIDSDMTFNDLYDAIDINDSKIYKYLADKHTDAVFQLESNMMKGIIGDIKPTGFEDIVVINSVGRPGPLAANMPQDYAARKNGKQDIQYPIKGCEDILKSTLGTIPYQEQLMAISKKIAGFDDMQADSLTRKTVAKKKVAMMPMLIRCHIYGKKNCEGPEGWEDDMNAPWYDPKGKYGGEIEGAVNRGYTPDEVLHYFNVIEKFSSYCFNRSHAACYSYIGLMTAYLKYYYPIEYMAAVLSMAPTDTDPKKNKRAAYLTIAEKEMKIPVEHPDINKSGLDFTPSDGKILYGLGSIKGVGEKALPDIMANAPYESLEDAMNRIPSKAFSKTIATRLVMAGAFDFEDSNRYKMLNRLMKLRIAKKKEREKDVTFYDEDKFDNDVIVEMETAALGVAVSVKPWWDSIDEGELIVEDGFIVDPHERNDKNGNLMAFPELIINNCKIRGVMFSSAYRKVAIQVQEYYTNKNFTWNITGKKDDRGQLKISKIELNAG